MDNGSSSDEELSSTSKANKTENSYPNITKDTLLYNKYIIKNRLGTGRFSRVYSAIDNHNNKYAIKMYRHGKRFRKYFDNEMHIFENLNSPTDNLLSASSSSTSTNDKKYIVTYIDSFAHIQYNSDLHSSSIHPCIVFNLLGDNIHKFIKNTNDGFSTKASSIITKQILLGLHLLHSKGIIHTDLSIYNLLLTKKSDEIKSNEDIEVVISDLGTSTFSNEYFKKFIGTIEYQAPEAVLELKYSTATDIWSLGCIVFELITGDPLFNLSNDDGLEDSESIDTDTEILGGSEYEEFIWSDDSESEYSGDDYDPTWDTSYQHFIQMESLLGKMPKHMSKLAKGYFNSRGELLHRPTVIHTTIKDKLTNYDVNEKESFLVENFIEKCLKYIPSERETANNLLKHPFIIEYNSKPIIKNRSKNKKKK